MTIETNSNSNDQNAFHVLPEATHAEQRGVIQQGRCFKCINTCCDVSEALAWMIPGGVLCYVGISAAIDSSQDKTGLTMSLSIATAAIGFGIFGNGLQKIVNLARKILKDRNALSQSTNMTASEA